MPTLCILFALAFAIAYIAATAYRDECRQWRQYADASSDLYEHCLQLEQYAHYLEARQRHQRAALAGTMMLAGWIDADEKMTAGGTPQ